MIYIVSSTAGPDEGFFSRLLGEERGWKPIVCIAWSLPARRRCSKERTGPCSMRHGRSGNMLGRARNREPRWTTICPEAGYPEQSSRLREPRWWGSGSERCPQVRRNESPVRTP